jgi:hypothetical protein
MTLEEVKRLPVGALLRGDNMFLIVVGNDSNGPRIIIREPVWAPAMKGTGTWVYIAYAIGKDSVDGWKRIKRLA